MAKLIIIGLPIGNIEDISLRCIYALFNANWIAAEDTRNYLKVKSIVKERFFEKFPEIDFDQKPNLISYREENHAASSKRIIEIIKNGDDVYLMSDAGMPLISDPGFRLVEECIKNNIEIDVIPSATAIETALVLTGLPSYKFAFIGFLPRQKSKIISELDSAKDFTIIFYESPYRLIKSLEVIDGAFKNVEVALCNDLTKKFQRVIKGNPKECIEALKSISIKGEWVIVLRIESKV